MLSFYVVSDWQAGCERCKEILGYGGMGHTMSIHSRNDEVILEFGLRKPAFRVVVNTPTTHGSIGLTTGLDPAMTLGCGGHGGNITSDNISPLHLLNVKRLAHEIRPATFAPAASPPTDARLPEPPPAPATPRLDGDTLAARVHAFLASRGVGGHEPRPAPDPALPARPTGPAPPTPPPATPAPEPAPEAPDDEAAPAAVAFVCEDDVRQALRHSRSIVVDDRTIVTPAARDLADRHRVFVQAGLSQ